MKRTRPRLIALRWQVYFWLVLGCLALVVAGLIADATLVVVVGIILLIPLMVARQTQTKLPPVPYPLPVWTVVPIGLGICFAQGAFLHAIGFGHLSVKLIGVTVGCLFFLVPIAPSIIDVVASAIQSLFGKR